MVATDLRAIWENGCTLWQSMLRYGPAELAAAFSAIPVNQPFNASLQSFTAALSKDPEAIQQSAAAQQLAAQANRLRDQLQAHIRQELLAGRLIAVGYAKPRKPDDVPTIIPKDVFSQFITFHNDTIKGNGLEFVAVRIVPKATPEPAPTPQRKPGRPSVREYIETAIAELHKERRINVSAPIASHFAPIRDKIAELHPDLEAHSLSDKALYKWVPQLLNAAGNKN